MRPRNAGSVVTNTEHLDHARIAKLHHDGKLRREAGQYLAPLHGGHTRKVKFFQGDVLFRVRRLVDAALGALREGLGLDRIRLDLVLLQRAFLVLPRQRAPAKPFVLCRDQTLELVDASLDPVELQPERRELLVLDGAALLDAAHGRRLPRRGLVARVDGLLAQKLDQALDLFEPLGLERELLEVQRRAELVAELAEPLVEEPELPRVERAG